jgi:hypothetical protein
MDRKNQKATKLQEKKDIITTEIADLTGCSLIQSHFTRIIQKVILAKNPICNPKKQNTGKVTSVQKDNPCSILRHNPEIYLVQITEDEWDHKGTTKNRSQRLPVAH